MDQFVLTVVPKDGRARWRVCAVRMVRSFCHPYLILLNHLSRYLMVTTLFRFLFDHLRAYNSAFQMTSFRANQVHEPGFRPTFRIQGQVYHEIHSLLPLLNSRQHFWKFFSSLTSRNRQQDACHFSAIWIVIWLWKFNSCFRTTMYMYKVSREPLKSFPRVG